MLQTSREAFFCRFFYLKNKKQARAKNDARFYFVYFACKKTPTAARRHSLVPLFHTTCVKLYQYMPCNILVLLIQFVSLWIL